MTTPVSVVVVSRNRPDALERCLTALAQVDHPDVEVVVVCDVRSAPAIARAGVEAVVRQVPFEEPNISAARNAGIAAASGEIVAFLDDDAVPEPRWLSHLCAPSEDPRVLAAGGFVLGRNGISPQWQGRLAFADATTADLPLDGDGPHLIEGASGRGIKTEGTNMAVRRETLVAMGGFDEAFAFYLDETDLNLRLGEARAVTALVPLAVVHHGFAASDRRTADRVPRDLHEIGASLAVFLRKHGRTRHPLPEPHRTERRRTLLTHMRDGRMMPGCVDRLMATFDAGWAEGLDRALDRTVVLPDPPERLRFPTAVRPHERITARFWRARTAREQAAQAVRDGAVVSLLLLSYSTLYHRVRFTRDGVWEQRGGQFGRAERSEPLMQIVPAGARALREARRVERVRVPKP